LEDPRIERCQLHKLGDILFLAVCAMLSGANDFVAMEKFGHAKEDWLKKFLALPNGIPSHDTIGRVFSLLDSEHFIRCFLSWVQTIHQVTAGEIIGVDGKTVRASLDRAKGQNPLHVVSAWASANRVVLGQVMVDEKSNEITAIPQLLEMLELHGAIVTIDAMGCQKEIAQLIVEQKADYVLAVKDNHPKLYEYLRSYFLHLHETDFAGISCDRRVTRDKGHGRREERRYFTTAVPSELREQFPEWAGLQSIGQAINITHRNGEETSEVRFFISSLKSNAGRLAKAVRGHWGIENSLHWVLDVTFEEDRSRIRKGHGPENFALLRRLAIALIKRANLKGSIRRHRKTAGWSNDHLLTLLAAAG
jgi:predicted transposase YbfD/YdcC